MVNNRYKSKVLLIMGAELRKVRQRNRLSGSQLAQMIDVSQQQISRYERGYDNMKINTLLNILAILGVSPSEYMNCVFKDTRLLQDLE